MRYTIGWLVWVLLWFGFSAQSQQRSPKIYTQIYAYDKAQNFEKIFKGENKIIKYGSAHNDTTAAALYFILGVNHLYYGDVAKAATYIRKSYNSKQVLGWGSDEEKFDYSYYKAISLWYNEELEAANSGFEQLLALGQETYPPNDDNILIATKDYATFLEEIGKLGKADSLLQQAITRGAGNTLTLPQLLAYRGVLANEIGKYQEAKAFFYQSLAMLEPHREEAPEDYAGTLSNLGNLYNDLGQFPVSEQMQTKALTILKNIGESNSTTALSVMHNLAYANNALGLNQKAKELYQTILSIESEADDPLLYATTLNSLGIVYFDLAQYANALQSFEKARHLFKAEAGENNRDYTSTLNNEAKAYRANGQYDSALFLNQKALALMQHLTEANNPELANYYHSLGLTYYAMGRYLPAKQAFLKAFNIRSEKLGKLNPKFAETAFELAKLHWAQNNPQEAETFFSSALESYISQVKIFFPSLSEYERTKFFNEKIKPSVETFFSYALENSNSLLLEQLMYYRLQTKGLLYYSSTGVRNAILASHDSTLIATYNDWLNKRNALAKLIQNNKDTQTINRFWEEINQLEKTISAKSTAFSKASKPIFVKDIEHNLKPGEQAIEMIRYPGFTPQNGGQFNDSIFYAALILSNDAPIKLVHLSNGNLMEGKYLHYYSNIIKFLRPDEQNFGYYWARINQKLNHPTRVYLSTDGVYNNVNVNILFNPKTNSYVLDSMNVIPVTSLATLAANPTSSTSQTNKTATFFGYPTYDKLVTNTADNSQTINAKIASAENNASFELVSNSLYKNLISKSLYKPLPGTLIEVEHLYQMYKEHNNSANLFIKEAATEEQLKTIESPTVLHIATHGFFLTQSTSKNNHQPATNNPLLQSGLVLAGAKTLQQNPSLSSENGILTAYEAMNLNLTNTQLVVMSACETGLGKVSSGEGVYGLQRAFQIAGAHSVVMSMWTVNDTATQKLMELFYDFWLQGLEKHNAFRQAQLELKKQFKQPYYWGAFVMNGR